MNEHMLEIKALNLILSLLSTLILVSWSRFYITVHSGEAPARPPHVTLYKIHSFETH